MRHLIRIGSSLATVAGLILVLAGTTLAGNFGEVTILDEGDGPPSAGEVREIRFALLQHGVTPIEDGRVDLTISNPATGDEITARATHEGDGIWAATVTFPEAGDWRVSVAHQWFETSEPTPVAVGPAQAGWLPAALAIAAFVAAIVGIGGAMVLMGRPAAAPAPARGAAEARS